MNKNRSAFVILAFLTAGIFLSCTEFFSTSLFPWAARDPASLLPPVTAGNVQELLKLSESNPDMALALLKGIKDTVSGASDEELAALQGAALEAAALIAAANAVALGPTILNTLGNANDISGMMEDPDSVKDMILDTLNSLPNLEESSSLLTEILPEPGTQAFDDFVEKANSEDLVMAAALIIAAEAKGNIDDPDYISNIDPENPPAEAALAAALAVAAVGKMDESGTGGSLKDILKGLNLVKLYTITFESNGGSSIAQRELGAGAKISKPADPVLDGSVFEGWYKEADFTTPWDFDVDTVTADITLYAKWDIAPPTQYTVTFEGNNGEDAVTEAVDDGGYAADPGAPAVIPASPPDIFAGWYTDDGTFLVPWTFASDPVTADITLYAKWE
ncbi:MAG: InlB B-repeat-containing protein [Treponema sp.]|nr:InlB B-repeat-containing protein [Treponema sp.]